VHLVVPLSNMYVHFLDCSQVIPVWWSDSRLCQDNLFFNRGLLWRTYASGKESMHIKAITLIFLALWTKKFHFIEIFPGFWYFPYVTFKYIHLHFVFTYFKSFLPPSDSTHAVRNQFLHPYITYPLLVKVKVKLSPWFTN
jgi:hypothetical protein